MTPEQQTPAELAAEVKRLADSLLDKGAATWRVMADIHAAIDRLSSLASSAAGEPVAPMGDLIASIVSVAWRDGWARCRDAEYVGEAAMDVEWGFHGANIIEAALQHLAAPAPTQPAEPDETMTLQEVWDLAGGLVAMENPSREYVEALLRELSAPPAPERAERVWLSDSEIEAAFATIAPAGLPTHEVFQAGIEFAEKHYQVGIGGNTEGERE